MTIWETIASEAAAESALWDAALRPASKRELDPVFSSLGQERFALAVETIYEGYLLHYGRSRLFGPPDGDTAVLLGDYLYAHGLVRLARHGDVRAVADLAELISLCTQLRAGGGVASRLDGPAWAATACALGCRDGGALDAGARLSPAGGGPRTARGACRCQRGRRRSRAGTRSSRRPRGVRSPADGRPVAHCVLAAEKPPDVEGRDIVLSMLVVGLIFLAVIAIGGIAKYLAPPPQAPRE